MKNVNNDVNISNKQYLNLQLVKRYFTPVMRQLGGLDYYFWGGALRDLYMGRTPNDIDMGTTNRASIDLITARLESVGWRLEVVTPYGQKLSYLNTTIDVSIWQTMPLIEKMTNIDFTINTLGITSNSDFLYHKTALDDIDNKILKEINKKPEVGRPDIHTRSMKFYGRGFTHQNTQIGPAVDLDVVTSYVDNLPWAEREFDFRK
jgi:hypothetical protein